MTGVETAANKPAEDNSVLGKILFLGKRENTRANAKGNAG